MTKSPGHYAPLHHLRQTAFPAFFPSGKWVQTTILKGGHIHLTALVEWEGPKGPEKTVFQRLNPSVFPDPELLAENNAVIVGHLRTHSYPKEILQPMYTPEGLSLVPAPGGPWRAFPYFSETYARTQAVDAGEVRKAAAAVGEWHNFLKDLDPGKIQPAIPRFFDLTHRWGQWEYARQNALPDRTLHASAEIAQLESGRHLVDQFERLRESDIFPLRILHGDPKLSNLLFDEKTKEIRAIIDWDTVQPGWIVFDFGDMVRAYTNPCAEDEPDPAGIKIHQPYLDALLDGFLSQTQHWLTPAERDHLLTGAQWVIWTQALRFLADYLIGDRYYPASYPEHSLVRGRNQLKLLESF